MLGREISESFDAMGAESNAFTSKDHTCFWARLLDDDRIVRHQGKIRSTLNTAQRAIELIEEHGSLAAYFWPHATFPDRAPSPFSSTSANRALPSTMPGKSPR